MKLPDLTELALRNLRESLLRNSLTTVGISVGVASLVAMLSLGIGLQQMAYALGNDAGFSRSGARDHQERSIPMSDGPALRVIQIQARVSERLKIEQRTHATAG